MKELKIKLCPFCGTRLTNEKPSKLYVHEKTGCILDLRAFTEDQLDTWNMRKPVETLVDGLEMQKEKTKKNVFVEEHSFLGAIIEIIKEEVG